MSSNKILLVDGSNLVKRCFHAVPPRKTKDGMPVNAIYGFLRTLINESAIFKFNTIYVALDTKTSNEFRRNIYADYKVNRKPKTEEEVAQRKQLHEQSELLINILKAANIHVLRHKKYEADDLIASLASKFKNDNMVYILSADKDLLQLIEKNVYVISPGLGHRNKVVVGEHNFSKIYEGLKVPSQILDLKVLSGDSSDNIKGLTRVGDKTALKLIAEFETVTQMQENLESLPEKFQKLFQAEHDIIERNKQIIKLVSDIEIPEKYLEFQVADFRSENIKKLYEEFNINPWID